MASKFSTAPLIPVSNAVENYEEWINVVKNQNNSLES